MAGVAGIINRAGRDDDQAFREVLSGAPEEIADLARAVRDLVYDVLPETPVPAGDRFPGSLRCGA